MEPALLLSFAQPFQMVGHLLAPDKIPTRDLDVPPALEGGMALKRLCKIHRARAAILPPPTGCAEMARIVFRRLPAHVISMSFCLYW